MVGTATRRRPAAGWSLTRAFHDLATVLGRLRSFLTRVAASRSAMKRPIVPSSTASGRIRRKLAHRAKRERPLRTPWSAGPRSRDHASSGSTSAVLSIGRRPDASIAAARSLQVQLLGRSLGCAVFFYANWHLSYNHVGYFDGPATEKPLLHTWSLAVEEQFYLVWPLLFIALYHFVDRKALPHVILALLCLSLAASQYILQKDAAAAFYLLPYRAWELLLGAYYCVPLYAGPVEDDRNLFRRAWGCSDRLCGSVFQCSDAVPRHPLSYSVRRSRTSNFCGPAGQPSEQFRSRRKAAPFRRQDIVFALLDTLASFSLTRMTLDRDTTQGEGLIIIAVSVVAATLTWHFVESPARKAVISFPALAGVTASAMLAIGLCGSLFNITQGLPFRVSDRIVQADAARDAGHKGEGECRPVKAPVSIGCAIGSPPHDDKYDFVIWGDFLTRAILLSLFRSKPLSVALQGLLSGMPAAAPFSMMPGFRQAAPRPTIEPSDGSRRRRI